MKNGSHAILLGQPLGHKARVMKNIRCISRLDGRLADRVASNLKSNEVLHSPTITIRPAFVDIVSPDESSAILLHPETIVGRNEGRHSDDFTASTTTPGPRA